MPMAKGFWPSGRNLRRPKKQIRRISGGAGLSLGEGACIQAVADGELCQEEEGQDGGDADNLGPSDVADHGDLHRVERGWSAGVALPATGHSLSRWVRMASLVAYKAALANVQAQAEALGLGYDGVHPKALFDGLRAGLPTLAEPVDAFHRPGQRRAQARVLAQCEELLVAVAVAMHSGETADEAHAVEQAHRLCRLLQEARPILGLMP